LSNKVVVFDLDGTLLNSRNEIIGGAQTLKCLSSLKKMGCALAICTGRLDHDIIRVDTQYNLDIHHRISQNGAVVSKENKYNAILLDKEEAMNIYLYIKNKDIRIELNTVSNRYWKTERDPDFPKEFYDSHIIRENYEEIIVCQPTVLFLLIGVERELDEIEEYVNSKYKNTKAVKTSKTSLEILHKKASKGNAIETLYPGYEVYAIGDSPNDFDMFPIVKQGYLVSDIECPYRHIKSKSILESLQDIISCIKCLK